MAITNCPNCKATIDSYSSTCEYCDTDLTPFFIDDAINEPAAILAGQYVNKAQVALDVLKNMMYPDFKHAAIATIWWLLAISTFGIVALVWRRKRAKYNWSLFREYDEIIESNLNQAMSIVFKSPKIEDQMMDIRLELEDLRKRNNTATVLTAISAVVLFFLLIGVIEFYAKLLK